MKNALIVLMVVSMMLGVTGVALAGTEKGDKEIQIQGAISRQTDSETDREQNTTSIQLNFNYFFTSNLSIGGTWWGNSTVSKSDSGDESTITSNFLLLRGDFYLGSATSKLMPYIGVQVGQSMYTFEAGDFDDSGSTSAYGWHGGLKIFASENTSWNFEINSTTYTPDVDSGEEEIDYTNTQFLLGFSYYF